jgi:hypothetical protein
VKKKESIKGAYDRVGAITRACYVDGLRRPSIKDRREVDTTRFSAAVFRRSLGQVRTLDPARGSSSACAPSLVVVVMQVTAADAIYVSRSVTMGISSSSEPPDDAHFTLRGHWIGFAHLSA